MGLVAVSPGHIFWANFRGLVPAARFFNDAISVLRRGVCSLPVPLTPTFNPPPLMTQLGCTTLLPPHPRFFFPCQLNSIFRAGAVQTPPISPPPPPTPPFYSGVSFLLLPSPISPTAEGIFRPTKSRVSLPSLLILPSLSKANFSLLPPPRIPQV